MMRAIAVLGVLIGAAAAAPFAQAPLTSVWSGWVQCQVVVQGPGYTSRQTHSWEIAGAPSATGAIAEYPATWTVVGDATIDTTDPQRSIRGTRRTEGSVPGARIGIFARASDNRLVVLLRSSQLSLAGGTTGTQQITSTGSSQPTTQQVTSAVFEWRPLPPIEDVTTSTHLSGKGLVPVSTRLDPLQPASATGQAACMWDFVRGGQASPLPRDGAAVTPTLSSASRAITPSQPSTSGSTSTSALMRPAPAPRTIALGGFGGTGIAGLVPPRTIAIAGFSGAGVAGLVPPRTIALAGFGGSGIAGLVPPRTIAIAGFSGAGVAGLVPPRTIRLTGFSGSGAAP